MKRRTTKAKAVFILPDSASVVLFWLFAFALHVKRWMTPEWPWKWVQLSCILLWLAGKDNNKHKKTARIRRSLNIVKKASLFLSNLFACTQLSGLAPAAANHSPPATTNIKSRCVPFRSTLIQCVSGFCDQHNLHLGDKICHEFYTPLKKAFW